MVKKKNLIYTLKKYFNLSANESLLLCNKIGLNIKSNFFELELKQKNYLLSNIKKDKVNWKLDKKKNIDFLKSINCYKGIKHKKFLPVNGQNTKNNAKTRKKFKIQ